MPNIAPVPVPPSKGTSMRSSPTPTGDQHPAGDHRPDPGLSEVTIPRSLADSNAADFQALAEVLAEVEAEAVGSREQQFTAAELLPSWQDPQLPKRAVLARVDGGVVGCAVYEVTAEEAPECWASVSVRSGHRGRGIGSQLLGAILDIARAEGHLVVQGYLLSTALPADTGDGAASGSRLPSPTGFGSVPADAAGTRFALFHGFVLEQVERVSRLALPLAPGTLEAVLAGAAAKAGDHYRVLLWEGATPERWLADVAEMFTRMSTEYPSANLQVTEDVWDPTRVRLHDDREAASPRRSLVAAALHVPSGHLVGYTGLSVPPDTLRAVSQEDTIVLAGHRGHRLGMLLKAANLQQLAERSPQHPSVITYNAEENRPMLAVNEQLGFAAIGYEGLWKRLVVPGSGSGSGEMLKLSRKTFSGS